jgi:hypothetical protein
MVTAIEAWEEFRTNQHQYKGVAYAQQVDNLNELMHKAHKKLNE